MAKKILTPRQIINKYHSAKEFEVLVLTLSVAEIIKLIKAYHSQFEKPN